MPDIVGVLNLIAQAATAAGVGVAGWQLLQAKRLAAQQFEDQIAAQYRELIRRLPAEALLGEELDAPAIHDALPAFIHYFDLSNEQAFLHSRKRISEETWANWRDGIKEHLQRPAFARAWSEVAARAPDSFDHLRLLCPPRPFFAERGRPAALEEAAG